MAKKVTVPKYKVTKITINGTNLLKAGKKTALKATVYPGNAKKKTLTWSSSNAGIVTVKNGVITALKPGRATITCRATDGSETTASYSVTVFRFSKNSTDWIAHRGLHTGQIENTAGAFRAAGQAGFWGCECDIHETKAEPVTRRELPQIDENAEYSSDDAIEQLKAAVDAISDDQTERLCRGEDVKNAQNIYDALSDEQKSAARAVLGDETLNKLFDASYEKEVYESIGIVINHDDTFKRTMGLDRRPGDMTAAEIKKQLPGVCFLEEYLAICNRYGMVPVIEFKNNMSDLAIKRTINMIYDIDGGKTLRSSHLISFNASLLSRVKGYCEERSGGEAPYTGYLFAAPSDKIEEARNRGFSGINIQLAQLTPDVQRKCDAYGLKIGTWTYRDSLSQDAKLYEHLLSGNYRLLTATVDYLPY